MKYWPEVLAGLLELSLALLQVLQVLKLNVFTDPMNSLLTITTAQITVLAFYVIIRLTIENNRFGNFEIKLTDNLDKIASSQSRVEILHEDEFYKRFGACMKTANKAVSISHLDTHPPLRVSREEQEYYETLGSLIKQNMHVRFQRLERISPEKIKWLSELVNKNKGNINFSLACIDLEKFERKSPYVSVQLVDEDKTFLVAITGHYSAHGKRDMYITDRDTNGMWRDYFDHSLWNKSTLIIENGVLYQKAWDDLLNHLEGS